MKTVKHDLEVRVTGRPQTERIVRCRIVSLREKLLTRLFGRREQMMILIPGPSVESVSMFTVCMERRYQRWRPL